MRRALTQSRAAIASAACSGRRVASLESARLLALRLEQRRAISVSQIKYGRRSSLSADDNNDSLSGNNKSSSSSSKKKGLWERASEKLSSVGSKTRSAGREAKEALEHQVDRSLNKSSHSGTAGERAKPRSTDEPSRKTMSGHSYDTRSGDKTRGDKRSVAQGDRSHSEHGDLKPESRSAAGGSKAASRSSDGASRGRGSRRNSGSDHRAAGSVRHEKDKMRFVLDLGDNQTARIDYKPAGNNRLELYHTEVPAALRGRGIGRHLAKGTFEVASRANLKLKLTCSYLEDYAKRHSDDKYKKLFD